MNYKTLICLIFMSVFIMTGCKDNDFYGVVKTEIINFSFINSRNVEYTRGTPIESVIDISNISVYGYYTGNGSNETWEKMEAAANPSFFDGIVVTNDDVGSSSASWSYSDPKYWPTATDANVSFFAYSPEATGDNGITIKSTTGVPVLNYSTPTTTEDQPDLMVAIPDYNLNKTSSSPVTLTMKHALTCIGFQGIGEGKVINSITVSGISLEGDLSMDGTEINWSNLSAPSSTTISVGLDNTTLTDKMSTNLTASNGYLMLIPQKLEDGAKITVSYQDQDTREFNISDSIWSAGQYICYNLYESSFTVSPSSLQVSALGEDTLSLSITCFPANTDWKLTSPVSWLKLSLNKDGSDSSSSVSGTGDDKVYVIIDTFILNTMDDRTAVIEADDETYNIQKQVNVTQYCMKNVPTDNDKKSYAGAFWRRSQRGERLIYIASTIGEWKAFVFWMDDRWNEGDIILKAESFSLPAEVVPAGDDTPFVTGSATSITGNTSSEGAISFVVGLNDYYTPTSEYPARYALLAITWDEGLSTQFVFLRQGEDPDYVMRPTDEYGDDQSWASSSNWRPNAVKVSPYNLTADTLNAQCNPARDAANPSLFTDFPTQAGAFFQWANDVNPRYAYSPSGDPTDWSNTWPTSYWNVLSAANESSPIGYQLTYGDIVDFRRPNDGSISAAVTSTSVQNSEIAQSLYYSPYSSTDNMIYAYLADGYFDRQAPTTNFSVSYDTEDVAYWGQLVYNPINKASIFIPYSGFIEGESGELSSRGQYINVWTSSSASESTAIIWNFNYDDGGALLNNDRAAGFSVRSVVNK